MAFTRVCTLHVCNLMLLQFGMWCSKLECCFLYAYSYITEAVLHPDHTTCVDVVSFAAVVM